MVYPRHALRHDHLGPVGARVRALASGCWHEGDVTARRYAMIPAGCIVDDDARHRTKAF
jgi:hypothetical protein